MTAGQHVNVYNGRMETTDLTIKLLQEIRDDGRKTRDELSRRLDEQTAQAREQNTHVNLRFEAIETSLRDLAQQLVMLARGIKVALESRSESDKRIEDHEQRLSALEKRPPH